MYDPTPSDAPVTERGKDSQMGQSSTVLKKFYGTSEQQPMRTSRFDGEIKRPVASSMPVCANKSSTTFRAGVNGEVGNYCVKEPGKSPGAAKVDGRPSTASITREDEVSMAPVMPDLWHEVIEEGGVTLQKVKLPEARGNECETIPLIANTPAF